MNTLDRPGEPLDASAAAEKVILLAYTNGVLTRSVAMQQLGLDWFGDLLMKLNAHGIKRPSASAADMQVMKQTADGVLGLPTRMSGSAKRWGPFRRSASIRQR